MATAALALLALSFGGPWITAVALKSMAAEFGGERSIPATAGALTWLGLGVGGILMGQIADRFSVRLTVMFGAVMICTGLVISTLGEPWHLLVGHGLFMGLLGNAGLNAPLYVYVSRWFDRRRGSALALISSGSYLAGALWPMVFERTIAAYGWRATMIGYGIFAVTTILPVAMIFLRPPPAAPAVAIPGQVTPTKGRVLGWHRNSVFGALVAAAFLCCVPMSMPQAHLVAFCTDLGIRASQGAAMLSVLLGFGFLSRQAWGWISDRIGGLSTIVISSSLQALALTAFLFTRDETSLFIVAALFGIGFSAIIPAYVLVIREIFPLDEARWRVPALLFLSGAGMAAGGSLAGLLHDMFGYYGPAFAAGVLANVFNLTLVGTLAIRRHYTRHKAMV